MIMPSEDNGSAILTGFLELSMVIKEAIKNAVNRCRLETIDLLNLLFRRAGELLNVLTNIFLWFRAYNLPFAQVILGRFKDTSELIKFLESAGRVAINKDASEVISWALDLTSLNEEVRMCFATPVDLLDEIDILGFPTILKKAKTYGLTLCAVELAPLFVAQYCHSSEYSDKTIIFMTEEVMIDKNMYYFQYSSGRLDLIPVEELKLTNVSQLAFCSKIEELIK